ncbi:MAG: type I-E CRISPR-associated protein Cas6/Cse3/CasE [Sulfobacillus sp.]
MSLYMIDLRLSTPALLQFFHDRGFGQGTQEDDMGYTLHTWLTAAFGGHAPKPWRLLSATADTTRILGYSSVDADTLRQDLDLFAPPDVYQVLHPQAAGILSRPMPTVPSGTTLGFDTLICPVARQSRTGIEKDLWCFGDVSSPDRTRDAVYGAWLAERIHQTYAAHVTTTALAQWRLVQHLRQTQPDPVTGQRFRHHSLRPYALMRGMLTVRDSDAFTALLAHGIGRHRAFGYGMLLLRPQ